MFFSLIVDESLIDRHLVCQSINNTVLFSSWQRPKITLSLLRKCQSKMFSFKSTAKYK